MPAEHSSSDMAGTESIHNQQRMACPSFPRASMPQGIYTFSKCFEGSRIRVRSLLVASTFTSCKSTEGSPSNTRRIFHTSQYASMTRWLHLGLDGECRHGIDPRTCIIGGELWRPNSANTTSCQDGLGVCTRAEVHAVQLRQSHAPKHTFALY